MRILIVSYYFPPFMNVGGFRAMSWARSFHDAGHDVTVLKGDGREAGTVAFFHETLDRELRVITVHNPLLGGSEDASAPPRRARFEAAKDLLRSLIPVLDGYVLWSKAAIEAARHEMGERGRFDAVVSTSFPLSAHSVAEAVKDLCGAAWVADFRDFYGQFASNGIGRRTPRGAFLARRIAAWGRKAEAITTVSERLADILGRWMGGRRPLVVFNGYFAEHLPRSAPGKPGRTILYAGSFNAQEFTLDPLIAAFRLLQERGVTPPELQFSGTPSAMICALLDAAGIKARFLGAQSNRNLLELQRDAGFLLLLDAMSGPGALLTKTFEYLAARRPMVVVSRPGSDLRETVFDAPAPGYCVSIEANEIADFLASWLERNLVASSEDFYPQDRITHYSRETQARLLLAELERLVAAKAGQ